MAKICLGLVQMNLGAGPEANVARAAQALRRLRDQGATLALLPEFFPWPWFASSEDSRAFARAEPEDGPTVTRMREEALRAGIAIAVPIYERAGEHRYNTTFVLSEQGDVLLCYRKNHVPYHPGWYEKFYYECGDRGFPVFHHRGATLGVQTCWDNMLPEGSRILALAGAQVILAPRASGSYSRRRWRTVLAGNALANGCFVATANRAGMDGGVEFGGDSLFAGPDGEVLAAAAGEDAELALELDLERCTESRAEWPLLADRRPSLYRAISGDGA